MKQVHIAIFGPGLGHATRMMAAIRRLQQEDWEQFSNRTFADALALQGSDEMRRRCPGLAAYAGQFDAGGAIVRALTG